MNTVTVDILNPKTSQLLEDLADLKLFSLRESSGDGFLEIVNTIRDKAKSNPPSLKEIAK